MRWNVYKNSKSLKRFNLPWVSGELSSSRTFVNPTKYKIPKGGIWKNFWGTSVSQPIKWTPQRDSSECKHVLTCMISFHVVFFLELYRSLNMVFMESCSKIHQVSFMLKQFHLNSIFQNLSTNNKHLTT